jgi:lysyl-tRNA synthetase class I
MGFIVQYYFSFFYQIRHLLHRVEETLRSLHEPQGGNVDDEQHGGWFRTKIRNILNWLQDAFAIDEHYWLIQDENSKAQEHLVQVSKHLRTLFQVRLS